MFDCFFKLGATKRVLELARRTVFAPFLLIWPAVPMSDEVLALRTSIVLARLFEGCVDCGCSLPLKGDLDVEEVCDVEVCARFTVHAILRERRGQE